MKQILKDIYILSLGKSNFMEFFVCKQKMVFLINNDDFGNKPKYHKLSMKYTLATYFYPQLFSQNQK